jgi:3-phosphoshikimate 1-carboxyvinyltransferase
MAAGFEAMGVAHEATRDGMCIEGKPDGVVFRGGEIDSRGDHRIAMAFSVASLRAAKPIAVRDTANVATSFPGFVALARAVGLDLAESSVSSA